MISDIRIQRASREWTIVADVDSSTEEIVITFTPVRPGLPIPATLFQAVAQSAADQLATHRFLKERPERV